MAIIRTLFIFEILGKPAEHIKKSLEELVGKIDAQDGIEVVRKKIHEPKKAESKDKDGKIIVSPDLYSTFAEVEIVTENIQLILTIVLNMLPAHVEIIEPSEYTFKNFELSSLLSDLTVKIHRYDEMAKIMMIDRKNLLRKLEDHGISVGVKGDSEVKDNIKEEEKKETQKDK